MRGLREAAAKRGGPSSNSESPTSQQDDTRKALTFHPLAELFPLLEGADFDELVADVRGPWAARADRILHEEKILDGRNRYRACLVAGSTSPRHFDGDDPVGFVISPTYVADTCRSRSAPWSRRSWPTFVDGQRADLVEGLPIGRASELLNVGERTVARAREVQDHGTAELGRAVEQGKVSVSAAGGRCHAPGGGAARDRGKVRQARSSAGRKGYPRRANRRDGKRSDGRAHQ